ncbi:Allantoate transport protein [Lasiodiplodia theobromae]|uniref:Allantoate transport protein n=1 Tax=Lasiodiplodia theobromae TaxID=45133 RepID=UPI0015C2D5A9|nr:Allantoate transport protein [Lasiodiplodia theobromae]KAF4535608.1 Allantoate transport protein [Lasiodiplodia theobromae]
MEKSASLEASAAAEAAAPASAVATGPGGGGSGDEHNARRISSSSSAGQHQQQGQDRNRSHGTALRASISSSSSSSAAAAGDGGGGGGSGSRACGRSHGPAAATSGAAAGPQPAAAFDKDKDVGLTVVGERAQEYDPRVEARVLRKIDWFLMPTMIIGYGLVYYDKAILGSAALLGMSKTLQLTVTHPSTGPGQPATTDSTRLSWATSLFYFGMLAGLYPLTFILQRLPQQNRTLGAVIVLWGVVCMSTAGVTTYRGLYVQRFFLGFLESVVPTGFTCIVSSFYAQREQALRQSIWFASTGLFTIVGAALNYGFGSIDDSHTPLERWQYLYLAAGAATILFGAWCWALVPDSPATAWFLRRAEERRVAVERLRRGATGTRCTAVKGRQVVEALLRDVKTPLVFVIMAAAYTVNGAVSGFGPLIVSTFGYSPLEAILLQFPLGGVCLAAILLSGWLSSRFRNLRLVLLVLNCLPVMAGCAMIWRSAWTHRAATPVAGYSIIGTFGAVVSLVITIAISNVAGATKKSTVAAAVFVAYCVGNIVGPQLVKSQTKDRHYPELWLGLIIW